MTRTVAAPLAALAAASLLTSLAAQNVGVTLSNAIDGYIEVPYAPQVVPQSGITVEAWVTYDDATIPMTWRYPTIVRQGLSVGGSEDYFLRVEAGSSAGRTIKWKVVTANGVGYDVNWPFAAGQLLTWTHIAATYDGATSALYINGALVGSTPCNGMPIRDVGNEVFRIGKGSDVGTPMEVWNGDIDEVRLWPFARTQAEIQQTMNLELGNVPGLVSTWNLNGNYVDTSGGMHATATGAVTPSATGPALTPTLLQPAYQFGASTPGCLGPIALSVGSIATPGNLAFAPVCTRAPSGSFGMLLVSLAALPAPIQIAGFDLWVSPVPAKLLLGSVNGLGTVRCGLPIPASVPPGFTLALQFGILDPCGPQGITASDAASVVLQ